ncbi:peptidase, S54 family [Aeromicrobium marinum DSM 15272]|uniref:Peptidase, S54 family n=1 Tax=Aeromicrobium marinum DSM 15272 TaxID=585531 RepID=E2S8T5_9ACTN|nr:rhomboid family intramembrane serine protease [Aeromicrobium marinum]EFQ84590.1 peptidase, S54 family [Aeromicrobium marinum DSM 15272]
MNDSVEAARCHLHPEREAYISCQRCGRPICPDCMRDAAVGFQCPTCVAAGRQAVRQPRTLAGGRVQAREGVVTMAIIAVNVVVFALTDIVGTDAITAAGRMVGADVIDTQGRLWPGMDDGGYWRLLTSAFLHAGVLHLLFNMYALYLFGPFVERALGSARYVAAYLTMAVFSGAVVYLLTDPRTFTVGASGAVFGLFGYALVLLVRAKQDVRTLLVLLAVNGVISLAPNISWQGHLGGFIAGLTLGAAVAYAPRERRTLLQVVSVGGLLALSAVIVVARSLTG